LRTFASVLSVADPDKVANLAAKATEARAKAPSASGALARARVVYFATHVLLAGETAMLAANHGELGTAVDPAQEEGGRRVRPRSSPIWRPGGDAARVRNHLCGWRATISLMI
jgi:hypothetical protein